MTGAVLRLVYVDKPECTSCGLCAETHPDVFRMDQDDLAEAYGYPRRHNLASIENADGRRVQRAVDACPGECIHWRA